VRVEAPRLLGPEERARLFDARWSPEVCGIAVGRPVTDGGGTHEGRRSSNAVDGNSTDADRSSWVVTPPFPRWVTIDLEEVTTVVRVQICLPAEDATTVSCRVEVSADGAQWGLAGEVSECRHGPGSNDENIVFPAAVARYVRVTFLSVTPESNLRVTEVRVFGR
jgi:hypothetical protein